MTNCPLPGGALDDDEGWIVRTPDQNAADPNWKGGNAATVPGEFVVSAFSSCIGEGLRECTGESMDEGPRIGGVSSTGTSGGGQTNVEKGEGSNICGTT